ncbi:transcription factor that binds to CRE motif [Lecanicillium sp. MT-2017a]|nr:transcription factor that binds to CRE motif [Lecanicillium sp. MT-2017a]
MATQSQPQASPAVKLEASPAESFLSAPGDNYQSLFASTDETVTTMNPMEMMTPQSYSGDVDKSLERISEQPEEDDDSTTSDKKQTKKRKSWGQVLPEPKTNLPPRKRAKTDDEKEQRRVERVLRNRRAAQSSRERKRLEVEALEQRNKELETLLISAQKANLLLVEELNRFRRDSGVVTRSSSPLDSLRDNQISLSPELFSSQDGHKTNPEQPGKTLVDELMMSSTNPTVNPASLSPELGPVPDSATDQPSAEPSLDAKPSEQTDSTSPDMTQRFADSHVSSLGLDSAAQDAAPFSLGDSFGLSTAADTDRYVLESGLLASPNSSTVDDDYLAGDSAAGFELFDINDFLHDEANHVASDIMAASNYAAAEHGLDFKVHDSETQVSSENPLQQPQSGASSLGCDDGGIAVGF